jgi:D-lyxose ketol-isomerase
MKRSELNKILQSAVEFLEKMKFRLPPFAYWSSEVWKSKGSEYDEIRDNLLGWDITDFGRVLVGEVSRVNDDRVDNRFYNEVGRFPAIEEDEKPLYFLCNEYPY